MCFPTEFDLMMSSNNDKASAYSLMAIDALLTRGLGGVSFTSKLKYNGRGELIEREVIMTLPDLRALETIIILALKEDVIDQKLIIELVDDVIDIVSEEISQNSEKND